MPYQEEDFTVKWNADADDTELADSGPSEVGDDDSYDQIGGDGVYLSIGLDEEHNEGKTTFCPGDDAYISVYRPTGQNVTLQAAIGNIKEKLADVPVEIEETINCDNSSSINLCYEPVGNVAIIWAPPIDAAETISGRTITLSKPVFSIATITYKTLTDVWMLSGIAEESSVRVLANMGETTSAMTVSFLCDAEETPDGEEEEIALTTMFCDTGAVVGGVKIWVNGRFYGSSNAQGIVNIGTCTIGETVTVKWQKGAVSGEVEKTL